MESSTWQRYIFESVRARGYLSDVWTKNQLIGRQAEKLVEELAELAETLPGLPWPLRLLLKLAGKYARWDFDRGRAWQQRIIEVDDPAQTRSELRDVTVVVNVMAELLGFEAQEAAYHKSLADITRGRRKE